MFQLFKKIFSQNKYVSVDFVIGNLRGIANAIDWIQQAKNEDELRGRLRGLRETIDDVIQIINR
jgi:hypothetical protein